MRKIKIKSLPEAKDGAEVKAKLFNGVQQRWPMNIDQFSVPDVQVNTTLQPVDREKANLEAEKGEQAIINQGGIPTNFTIGGKRHSEGGTPLNLPDNSFIFSDTKDMKIKDPEVLAQFGITSGVYTPAEIAKKYDINKYRAVLADPDSSKLDRKTAEMMISNYNLKLSKLALIQESKKGFPQGIPGISMPYVESMQINPADFLTTQSQETNPTPDMMAAFGGELMKAQNGMQFDYSKEISSLDDLKKKVQRDKVWNEAYQKSYNDQLQAWKDKTSKANQNLIDLHNKERVAQFLDTQIKEKLRLLQTGAWKDPIYGSKTYNDHEQELVSLMEKQKAITQDWNKINKKIDPAFKTQADYDASLLQPFSQDKKDAQIAWNLAHPGNPIQKVPVVPAQQFNQIAQPMTTPVDTSGGYEVELTEQEAKDLGVSWKMGGTIDRYQDGGTKKKKRLTPEQYLAYQQYLKKAKSKVATTTKPVTQSSKKPEVTGEFDPYGEAVKELQSHVVPNAMLRTGKVNTLQHETSKGSGVYGDEEIPVGQFLKNNPQFAKQFEAKHPGEKYNPKNPAHVAEFQQSYNPLLKVTVYNQYKKLGKTDDEANKMADIAVNEYGFKQGEKAREFDNMHGQFTGSRVELGFKDPEEAAAAAAISSPVTTPAVAKPLVTARQSSHDPWWLQDIIKTAGSAGDLLRVKKYTPWQATPGVTLPEPTFFDPTRQLAANAELANIGTQGLASFTNPQSFAAGFSQIQGQAGKNAADILGQYDNMNVGVANDFEIKQTDIMNQAAANHAGLSTQLADKYTIMNQQFDNSKNMARQNLRQSYIDAITNKNMTGNLNDLYDQYKIDPRSGGRIRWTNGRPIVPEADDNDTVAKINNTVGKFMEMNPGMSREKAFEAAVKLHSGSAGPNYNMYDPAAMNIPR